MYREIFVIVSIVCMLISAQEEYDDQICIGQEDGVLFGIPGYCTKYYFCQEEYGYLQDCAEFGDYQFDSELGDCNESQYVNCVEDLPEYPEYPEDTPPPAPVQTTAKPVQTTTPPSDPNLLPDVVCPTDRPGEILFFESLNCTEYYICANGVKLTMTCSEGFVFNKDDNQCDHPVYNPRCSNVSFDPSKNVRCNRHGFYTAAYPLDCTKYVFCAEGIPMLQQCPIGTAWNVDRCVATLYSRCFNPERVRM